MSVLVLLAIKVKAITKLQAVSFTFSKLELMISHCGDINSNMVNGTNYVFIFPISIVHLSKIPGPSLTVYLLRRKPYTRWQYTHDMALSSYFLFSVIIYPEACHLPEGHLL